jgi:UDP-N-acetylglucosamine 2-epimerase (non-hydrolysing)
LGGSVAGEGPIVHIVGARPNFMKAGPVIAAVATLGLRQELVHTGQHYDRTMSEVFFDELGLPRPTRDLGVGSGTHARQTAALLVALEEVLGELSPSITVVYGDVNSTLAAALVTSKLGLPMGHVEAGLRSFDRSMPEEINRVVTDALADILLVTSPEAVENLRHEGVPAERVHFVGNPMIDTLLANLGRFDVVAARARHALVGDYGVATLHRPANVDSASGAAALVGMLRDVAARLPIVLPLHPRGRATLETAGLGSIEGLHIVEPMGYIDFMSLVRGARLVVTDSGGIQEETTILGVPCLTVRPNTERPITISHGTNRLVEPAQVPPAVEELLMLPASAAPPEPPPLWDGHAGSRIAAVLDEWLAARAAA